VRERAKDKSDQDRERWVLTREQRITSLRTLPPTNHVVAGKLWSKPGVQELSVEADFARDLGAKLGTQLTFDVQGVPVAFEITSLRRVEWRRFAVSFFLVAEPGSLDDAPQFLLGAARVPRPAQQKLQDELAKTVPNVTVVRVQDILERAAELVTQLSVAIRLLGAFAMLTGLLILAGGVAATQLRRAREVALLKTLGVTRARVAMLFAVEYVLLGAVAGLISAAGAYVLTVLFTRGVLQMTSWPSLLVCGVGFVSVAVLSVAAGLLASVRALAVAPLEVFRENA
jgi:putative ABC transport system permease protein